MIHEKYPLPDDTDLLIDSDEEEDADINIDTTARIRLAGFRARSSLIETHF